MKILFTDLDGTLLNNESKVSEYSYDVLKRMTAAGHKLVLASGRPLKSIIEVKDKAGLDMPGVYITASNGALIYDCDTGVILHSEPVPMDLVKKIWDMALREGLHIQTYSQDNIITPVHDREIDRYTSKIHMPVIYTDDPTEVLKEPPAKMLSISLDDPERLEGFRLKVLKEYGDILDSLYSNSYYLEVYNRLAGKGESLKWLCSHLGVSIDDSYAAGDAMNDVSMIEAAGHGIVMLNAPDDMKIHADIITDRDNDSDGLALVIEREILN